MIDWLLKFAEISGCSIDCVTDQLRFLTDLD